MACLGTLVDFKHYWRRRCGLEAQPIYPSK
jgi:hypothetical protein